MKECSFCGNKESNNRNIIEGLNANICEECFAVCGEDFEDMKISISIEENKGLMQPNEIKEKLDEYVIGQEEAKRILSVAVYNHYKRINIKSKVDIQKTNVMLIGPTGSGKTYVMQVLADILDVPFVMADATTFTEKGYVGEDVESILYSLYQQSGNDLEKAQKGIVYIDEIDKIVARSNGNQQALDVGGGGVQQALLKMIEQTEVPMTVKNDVGLGRKEIVMNTKDILFVCGGAFVGLDKIVEKKHSKKKNRIGFSTDTIIHNDDVPFTDLITQADIVEYGFLPEFVGRVPVIASLTKLTKEELKDILLKPKNAVIKQYKELFKMDGVKVNFGTDAVDYIVSEALSKDVGARGLKGVIEKQMYNLMFELPKHKELKKFTITESLLKNKNKHINIDNYIDEDK